LSFSVDAILVRSPIRFLQDEIAQRRFLEGVVVAVMYFERFGSDRIEEYFKSKSVPSAPVNIQNLKVQTIAKMLEGFGLIDHRVHSLMGEVCQVRNDVVHKLRDPDAIDEHQAREAIEKAIECLKALGCS
jgi:hypothetical protein